MSCNRLPRSPNNLFSRAARASLPAFPALAKHLSPKTAGTSATERRNNETDNSRAGLSLWCYRAPRALTPGQHAGRMQAKPSCHRGLRRPRREYRSGIFTPAAIAPKFQGSVRPGRCLEAIATGREHESKVPLLCSVLLSCPHLDMRGRESSQQPQRVLRALRFFFPPSEGVTTVECKQRLGTGAARGHRTDQRSPHPARAGPTEGILT